MALLFFTLMMKLLQPDVMMSGVAAELVLLLSFLLLGCTTQEVGKMSGKKALVVIAPEGFQDHEFEMTVRGLEQGGISVVVASTRAGKCTGKFGTVVDAVGLDHVDPAEFDAIVFVGGPGVPIVRNDERAVSLAKQFYDEGKVVAAICWAPTILAKAGVLNGKKATVWDGYDPEYGKGTPDVLRQYGAEYVPDPVVVDGSVVTANGPAAAEAFGKTLAKVING